MQKQQDVDQKAKEQFKKDNLARIKHKVIVLSNKGGVGKSTISINLAYGLAFRGLKTGIMDTDIHGPSVNKMLGIEGQRLTVNANGNPEPIKKHDNLYALSTAAFIEDSDAPLIWRGPMKMKLLSQFLEDIEWPELDYLVVDSPPGTGDEPLSVIQLFDKIDYAVIVSTPQDIALLDVRKGINFLKQLNVKNIGLVENMSGLKCPHCGKDIEIFKKGGVEKAAKDFNIDLLGVIPMEADIANTADNGRPYIYDYNKGNTSQEMFTILDKIMAKIYEQKK
jgi:ATP-binding protein involved in chromosome partitioning